MSTETSVSTAVTTQSISSYRVIVSRLGVDVVAGTVSLKADGWRFIPNYQAAPSRKGWPTAKEAVSKRLQHFTLEAVRL